MLEWLRDLLTIYMWKEFWMIISVPMLVMVIWFTFSFMMAIPNEIARTILIWSLIFGLTLGAATVDVLRRERGKV